MPLDFQEIALNQNIANHLSFDSGFGLLRQTIEESGGSSAANRIPALLLSSLISIACMLLLLDQAKNNLKRTDEAGFIFLFVASIIQIVIFLFFS